MTKTWDTITRTALFFAIYQHIFYSGTDNNFELNWNFIEKIVQDSNQEIVIDTANINNYYNTFLSEEESYKLYLQTFLHDWSKTYSLVKALLFVLLLELNFCEDSDINSKNIFNRYLRLAQDYVSGESVGLVHAIMIKILESRGFTIKYPNEEK